MKTYHNSPDCARPRPFATGPYVPRRLDGIKPRVLPEACIWVTPSTPACQITLNHWRNRKTGPRCPIVVLNCKTHGHAFTFYPLGHFPYGRVAVAPVSGDGEPLRYAEPPPAVADGDTNRRLAWSTTLFAAALDAAQGTAWPRAEYRGPNDVGWWGTQLGYLADAAKLLGLDPIPPTPVAQEMAQQLEIPWLKQSDATTTYRNSRGYRERGCVIVSVLDQMRADRRVVNRLLACGALSACWGVVHRWDPAPGGARRCLFPPPGTAPP